MKYDLEQVWLPFSENILNRDFDFHDLMLNDEIRMRSYEKAIKHIIKPGMTVLDLGVGTGILSLWALEAGAKKVYGIEMDKTILKMAIKNINIAGYSLKFIAYNKLSYDVNLPEKVDIIISEILGNIADNENMVPILNDAKKRFLKKNGKMLPNRVDTFIVPVSSNKANLQIKQRNCQNINSNYGLNNLLLKLDISNPYNIYYDCIIPKSRYLSSPIIVNKILFNSKDKEIYSKKVKYVVERSGMLTGFKGYFIAELVKGVNLDISGDKIGENTSDSWKHCYLPIENSIKVKKGDVIVLNFSRKLPDKKSNVFNKIYTREGNVERDNKEKIFFKQGMDI